MWRTNRREYPLKQHGVLLSPCICFCPLKRVHLLRSGRVRNEPSVEHSRVAPNTGSFHASDLCIEVSQPAGRFYNGWRSSQTPLSGSQTVPATCLDLPRRPGVRGDSTHQKTEIISKDYARLLRIHTLEASVL